MIAVLVSQFNKEISSGLRDATILKLKELGADFEIFPVPGAVELPLAAQHVIRKKKADAVIALGAIVKGETDHYEWVSKTCNEGLTRVSLEESVPIIHGVQVGHDQDILKERIPRGAEYARTAVEMIAFLKQ